MSDTKEWEVVVGNVGTVYSGGDGNEAVQTYLTYIARSQREDGRAAGESVILMCGGDVRREYEPRRQRDA